MYSGFTRGLWIRLHGYDYTTTSFLASARNKVLNVSCLETPRIRNDPVVIHKIIIALLLDEFYAFQNSNTRGSQHNFIYPRRKALSVLPSLPKESASSF